MDSRVSIFPYSTNIHDSNIVSDHTLQKKTRYVVEEKMGKCGRHRHSMWVQIPARMSLM